MILRIYKDGRWEEAMGGSNKSIYPEETIRIFAKKILEDFQKNKREEDS